jgi:hypothetical protein
MKRVFRMIMPWLSTALVLLGWSSAAMAQGGQQAAVFKPEELEQLVAPIALYPDALLAQILMASTYPLEIVEAARWAKANPNLKDKALEDALQNQPWDPAGSTNVDVITGYKWELYHVVEDFSEAVNMADKYQDRLRDLQSLFYASSSPASSPR